MLNDLRGLKLLQQFTLCSWLNVSPQFVFVAVKLLTETICSVKKNNSLLDWSAMKILLLMLFSQNKGCLCLLVY